MQDFGLWDQPCSLFGVSQALRREDYGGFFVEVDRQRPRRTASLFNSVVLPLGTPEQNPKQQSVRFGSMPIVMKFHPGHTDIRC
jgi:hypothetical protein